MSSKTEISGGAVLLLSLLYFLGGTVTLAALLTAALVHEAGHIAAIKLFGGRLRSYSFDISGMCIDYGGLGSVGAELAALLAGPAAGLMLAYFASLLGNCTGMQFFLLLSGYSLMLSLLNLLPVLPLDGGMALLCAAIMLFGREKAAAFAERSGMVLSIAIALLGLFLLGRNIGASLLVCGMWLLTAQTGIVKKLHLL